MFSNLLPPARSTCSQDVNIVKIFFVQFRLKNATSDNKALTLNYLNQEKNKDHIR